MPRNVRQLLLVLLFYGAGAGGWPAVSAALAPEASLHAFVHRAWDADDGLPTAAVEALAETPDGLLWLGSSCGLWRFDGRRFDRAAADAISGLLVDHQGVLFAGTADSGLLTYRDHHWRRYGRDDGLPSLTLSALALDPEGLLLAATADGQVSRFTSGHFDPLPGVQLPVPALSMLADGPDRLFLATAQGLYLAQSERLTALGGPTGLRGLAPARGGGVAVVGAAGFALWQDGLWRQPFGSRLPVPLDAIAADQGGAFWLASGHGLYRVFPATGEVQSFERPHPAATLALATLLLDASGNLWLGSQQAGLHELRANPLGTWGKKEGLPSELLTAIAERADGSLWVGARNAGIARLDPASGRLDPAPSLAAGLPDLDVWSLSFDHHGRLWAGTSSAGPLVRRDDGAWVAVTRHLVGELQQRSAFTLFTAADGAVWAGTDNGLDRIDAERAATGGEPRIEVFTREHGLPSNEIRDLFADRSGRLWVGTTGGLALYRGGDRFEAYGAARGLPPREVVDIWQDELGAIWLASAGALVQLNGERARSLTSLDGLCSDELSFLTGDGAGHLWLGTGKGLVRIPLAELRARLDGQPGELHQWIFDRRNGLRGVPANHGAAALAARSGRLYFATRGGLVELDPRALRPQPAPPVAIEELGLQQPTWWQSWSAAGGGHRLALRFSASTLRAPEGIRLRYRLEGFDQDWRAAGPASEAEYRQLAPGSYRFLLAASDEEGRFAPPLSANIVVARRVDHLAAALLLLLASTLGLWAIFHFLRLATLKRREALLEQQVEKALADLKELRGMLPICSSCKKIRDDEGYWKDLGSYLQHHPGFEVTPGLCPSCEARHQLHERAPGRVGRVVRAVPGGKP